MSGWTRRHVLLSGAAAGLAALTGSTAACARQGAERHRQVYSYGPHRAQAAELRLPARPHGLAVLVHGGYWRAGATRVAQERIAADLVEHGWGVWNVDYRGIGGGGGWPGTFTDVAAALDRLADAATEHHLSTESVVCVGHSAGATLALWLAARPDLPGVPPTTPRLRVSAAVSQAGVNDLTAAAALRLGGTAVLDLVGGTPTSAPTHYQATDPTLLVPLRMPLLVVTGDSDRVLPVTQSTAFAEAARTAGDDVRLAVVPGAGHGDHLDPRSVCWQLTRDWLSSQRR